MVKAELKPLLERLGIAPSKRLGQNFLVDDQFRAKILHEADPRPGQTILEIGPGLGAITRGLVASGADVTAIEFDRKIAEYLRTAVVPLGLHLIEADACRVKYAELFPGDFRVVSNLPYSAGTIVIAKLLDLETPPPTCSSCFRRKSRNVSSRGRHGRLLRAHGAHLRRLRRPHRPHGPARSLLPEPTVDSALFALVRKPVVPPQTIRIILSRLARTSFAHRRKKMFKQAAAVFGADVIAAAMADASVDPDIRAERVTVDQFIRMAEFIAAHAQTPPETAQDDNTDADEDNQH